MRNGASSQSMETHPLTLAVNVYKEIIVQPPPNNCSFLIIWHVSAHVTNHLGESFSNQRQLLGYLQMLNDVTPCSSLESPTLCFTAAETEPQGWVLWPSTTLQRCVRTAGTRQKVLLRALHRSVYNLQESQKWKAWDAHAEDGSSYSTDLSPAATCTTAFLIYADRAVTWNLSVTAQSGTSSLFCRHSEGRRWLPQTSRQRCVPWAASEPLWSHWSWRTPRKPDGKRRFS